MLSPMTAKASPTSAARRSGALVLLWLALCGVQGWPSQPVDLMPTSARAMPFGRQGVLILREADHGVTVPFGTRPALAAEPPNSMPLPLRWTGRHYEISDPDPKAAGHVVGTLAVRPLPGPGGLHVAQTLWEGDAAYSYRLTVRLADGSFVYFHDNEECDAVPAAKLARIFPSAADRQSCRVRRWEQVEALLKAFAATGPQPFGLATVRP
jgi:hypothetical protein